MLIRADGRCARFGRAHHRRGLIVVIALVMGAWLVPGVAGAASATTASPAPTIHHLAVNKARVGASGGTVRVTAAVENARRCVLRALSVSVPGLPRQVSCAGGVVRQRVQIPANAGMPQTITLRLAARRPGARTAFAAATFRQASDAPTVSGMSVSPTSLTAAGGTVRIQATVSHAQSCEIWSVPAISPLPITEPCASGVVAAVVTVPSNPYSTGGTFRITVTATGVRSLQRNGAAELPQAGYQHPGAPQWENYPDVVDPGANSMRSVSCATTTFCVAVDNNGNALTYDGSHWSGLTRIDPDGTTAPSGVGSVGDASVSCPTTSFCAAVDGIGHAMTFNGQSWSAPVPVGVGQSTSVSCVSSSFCMALGGGFASVYNGSSWSQAVGAVPTTPYGPAAVSCVDANFCVAVSDTEYASVYRNGSWQTPQVADTVSGLGGVSCVTETFCSAVDEVGNAVDFDGANWGSVTKVDPGPPAMLLTVTCLTTLLCEAGSNAGQAVTYGGTDPGSNVYASPLGIGSISCISSTFCVATAGEGMALVAQ